METLHPGLYFQEVAADKPIEGVSTSTAAFVGVSIKGAVNEAVLITSWGQFVTEYGSFTTDGYLAYAVRSFFENGGTRCYCNRVATSSAAKSHCHLADGSDAEVVTVTAISEGTWGDDLDAVITNWDATAKSFTFSVKEDDVVVEAFELCTLATLEGLVNDYSKYVTVDMTSATPADVVFKNQSVALAGGNDGISGIADSDYIGTSNAKSGLYAFDGYRINMIAVPGNTATAVIQGIQTYVNAREDCMGIVECTVNTTPSAAITFKNTTTTLTSSRMDFLYPGWVYAPDPIGLGKSPKKLLPVSGYRAGAYAKADKMDGVWRSPAGTDLPLQNVLSIERNITDAEQDTLNNQGINVVRFFPGYGIVFWGARTCTKTDPDFKYINVRRSVDFVRESLRDNMSWTVFRNNDSTLWGQIKTSCESFLRDMWSAKGLRGDKESDAFFVVCDSSINTAEAIDLGRCYVDVGISVQKPAEFIIFRLDVR